MVLQDNRSPLSKSLLHIPRLDLDASRIVGTCGALLLNLGVLGLLLVPAAMPTMVKVAPALTVYVPVDRPKPPLPPPPIEVPVQTQQTRTAQPTNPVGAPPLQTPTAVDQVVVDQGTLPADTAVEVPTQATDMAPPSGPVAGIALRYLSAAAPPYPRDALRAGIEGTVMLKVLVDIDGRPIAVDIHRSSGSRKLDDAARRFVLANWRFEPAMQDGRAVQATGIVPIDFNLGR